MGELAEDGLYEDDRLFKMEKHKHKLFEVKVVKKRNHGSVLENYNGC